MNAEFRGWAIALSICAGCAPAARPPAADTAPVRAALDRVEAGALTSSFEAGGVVRARATAQIASRVMAPILRVEVRAGDRVRRGAALVVLDARDVEANRVQADATSAAAVESARAAEADLRAAESAVTLARATHDRISELHAKRSATAEELDRAVAALAAAEAQRNATQSRLAAAAAGRDAARAGADSAAIAATYTVLTAPFDAIVAERHADAGSMATPGTPLLTLEDPASYRLEAQIDEARAAFVQPGETVDVRIDTASQPEAGWVRGAVAEIARVDPASHGFLVKVDLPRDPRHRSGLFGRVRIQGATRQTLTVPASAIVTRGQLTFVYIVDADNRARLRPVSVGAAEAARVEVLAGLRARDPIVAAPVPALVDGARVAGAQP